MVVSYYCPTGVAAVVLAAGVADLPAAAASAAAFNFAAASAFALASDSDLAFASA